MIVPPVKLTINQVKVRCRSKREVVRILQIDERIYLPSIGQANHKYIADILLLKKKHVKNASLKLTQVPNLKELRVNDILEFARTQVSINEHLPVFKQVEKLPDWTWLCNVG